MLDPHFAHDRIEEEVETGETVVGGVVVWIIIRLRRTPAAKSSTASRKM